MSTQRKRTLTVVSSTSKDDEQDYRDDRSNPSEELTKPSRQARRKGNRGDRKARRVEPGGVMVTHDDEALVLDVFEVLADHPRLFQRGGQLVTVAEVAIKRISTADRKLRIVPFTSNSLREPISSITSFYTVENRKRRPCGTPARLMGMLLDRGSYPDGIKVLTGIAPCPIVRADGSVVPTTGYDSETGLFWSGQGGDLQLVAHPSHDDATAAVARLRELVNDFPFEGDEHFAGWQALVLTLAYRHLIDGSTPLFAIDGTTRGVGKGLLADAASLIVTGESLARLAEPTDDAETRKLITAIAIAGDTAALLDDVERTLSAPALAAVLTAEEWKDRVLGQSARVSLPWRCVLIATGNNLQFSSDIARRTLYIRLASPLENPEDRTDVRHADLRDHIRRHRGELLGAVITIMRAYLLAGRPVVTEQTWGSYEAWSRLIRQCVVWVGCVDPVVTRQALTARDTEASALRLLITSLAGLVAERGRGLTSAEIIEAADASGIAPAALVLSEALATLCPLPPGKPLTPAALGYRLRRYVGRVVGEQSLRSDHSKLGALWSVQ